MHNHRKIIFDGNIIDAGRPVLPAESRGLMYGDGCFETFRCYSGKFLHLEKHLERFKMGADYLGIDLPSFFSNEVLRDQIRMLLRKNDRLHTDSVIRMQLWRESGRGYGTAASKGNHFFIMDSDVPPAGHSLALATADTRRIPGVSLRADCKLSNNINYIKARREAVDSGADDALMLTTDDRISETTIANIFWIAGNVVYTPSEECDILPGITRRLLIELCRKDLEKRVLEGTYSLEDLKKAEMVWVCNSVRELLPVSAVNQSEFSVDSSFFNRLKSSFKKYKINYLTH